MILQTVKNSAFQPFPVLAKVLLFVRIAQQDLSFWEKGIAPTAFI